MFDQQIASTYVRVIQPEDSPSPVIWEQAVHQGTPAVEGLMHSFLTLTGQSLGPVAATPENSARSIVKKVEFRGDGTDTGILAQQKPWPVGCGNGTDLDNRCSHPIDTTSAIFQ